MKKALRVWTSENWRHEKAKVHVYPFGGDMLLRGDSRLLDVTKKQEMFQIRICAEKIFSFKVCRADVIRKKMMTLLNSKCEQFCVRADLHER